MILEFYVIYHKELNAYWNFKYNHWAPCVVPNSLHFDKEMALDVVNREYYTDNESDIEVQVYQLNRVN